MKGSSIWRTLLALLVAWLVAYTVWTNQRKRNGSGQLRVTIEMVTAQQLECHLFFSGESGFSQRDMIRSECDGTGSTEVLQFEIPGAVDRVQYIRFDPGEHPFKGELRSISLEGPYRSIRWRGREMRDRFDVLHAVKEQLDEGGIWHLESVGDDPYLSSTKNVQKEIRAVMGDTPPRSKPLLHAMLAGAMVLAGLLLLFQWWSGQRNTTRGIGVFLSPISFVFLAFDALVFVLVLGLGLRSHQSEHVPQLRLSIIASRIGQLQVYHAEERGRFVGSRVVNRTVQGGTNPQWIEFDLPKEQPVRFLRVDLFAGQDTIVVNAAELALGEARVPIPLSVLSSSKVLHDLGTFEMRNTGLMAIPNGPDPYFALDLDISTRLEQLRNEDRPFWSVIIAALMVVVLAHLALSRSTTLRSMVEIAEAKNVTFSTIFLIVLVLPAASWFHPGLEPSFPFSEKRKLATAPELELNGIGELPARFDAWYRDHFPFRKALFRWNSLLHLKLLRTSPLPEAVLVGKHGRFFQYDRKVDLNYRGVAFFTFQQLERIRQTYENRQRWLADQGIGFYLLIPPLSANLHPNSLPKNMHRLSDTTWLGQVSDHFQRYSSVPLIDVRAELLEAAVHRPIYYDTDIHWNGYGAYFGYRKLNDRIRMDRPDIEPAWPITELRFDPRTDTHADLAELLGIPDVLTREEMVMTSLREQTAVFDRSEPLPPYLRTNEPPQIFINTDTTKQRLLMFHDSFGVSLRPLISQHFSTSAYVWSSMFYPEAVSIHKPNVVVQELMEMFVPEMLNDTIALP